MAQLLDGILDSEGQRQVPLSGETIRLGRATDNDVQVSDGRVSKRHAEILCRDGRYVLRACFIHYATREADVDGLVEEIRRVGAELAAETGGASGHRA